VDTTNITSISTTTESQDLIRKKTDIQLVLENNLFLICSFKIKDTNVNTL